MSHDVIVIGAGINGLVAAHTLARAGRRVLVLEQRAEVQAVSGTGWLPPQVIAALGASQLAQEVAPAGPWVALALPDGGRLELWHDVARSAEAIRRLNAKDAAKWPEFCARMRQLGRVLEALYTQPAPDVETTKPGELLRLGLIGLSVKRMGRQAMIDLLRILPMSVADLLDEWFESDALKAALGIAGVMHIRQGPRSGGTAFNFLHHHVGSPAGVFRPPLLPPSLGTVLTGSQGVTIQRNAAVRRIVVQGGRVTGVVLATGDEVTAPLVVSGADPRATLLGLLDTGWLDPELALAVRNIKCRGVAAQVTFVLNGAAGFTTLAVAPSLTYLEKAYDAAKYSRVSEHPWFEATATGQAITAHVQYVPHNAKADGLGELVLAKLAEQVPGLREKVTGTDILAPADLEARFGLTEGHAYHGELTLDQVLFMRPVAGWSRYRTPVPGLYLCSAGTHPGGGIAGASGWLAAREVLKDIGR